MEELERTVSTNIGDSSDTQQGVPYATHHEIRAEHSNYTQISLKLDLKFRSFSDKRTFWTRFILLAQILGS